MRQDLDQPRLVDVEPEGLERDPELVVVDVAVLVEVEELELLSMEVSASDIGQSIEILKSILPR